MKGRKGKASGGEAMSGKKSWDEDLSDKPMRYTADSNVSSEAEERKRGGKVKKNVGGAAGATARAHGGRAARKSGGRTGSNMNPLSSAHSGTPAKGRSGGNRYD